MPWLERTRIPQSRPRLSSPSRTWCIATTALNGVSFEVRHAELFGLLGPNGSGKTTLFRILSTLMVPVGGRAVILGNDAATEPNNLRRQIGVVFQAQSIDIKLTS